MINNARVEFQDVETFIKCFQSRVENQYVIPFNQATIYQKYVVLAEMVKMIASDDWKKTNEIIAEKQMKQTYYFSMEFLMGRLITNNIMNAGVRQIVEEAFQKLGIDLNELEEQEADAGLGNGGLGRLAACFLDSAASLGLPVHGNSLRYQKGFFEQDFENGNQVERPDLWLSDQYVWEVRREDESVLIPFYGEIDEVTNRVLNQEWIKAVPYNVPIIGYQNQIVNTLCLWKAEVYRYPEGKSSYEYSEQVEEITSVLYPADDTEEGKYLRLKQQYLFSAAGVLHAIRKHKKNYSTMEQFHLYNTFQINDTHPSLVIPELMRYLMDEEGYSFEKAWDITTKTCAYTNHTIMAEALEKWNIEIMKTLLPRIYQIIQEIDLHFKAMIEKRNGKENLVKKMQIIDDSVIKMAHLAIVGSYSVNGVAELHTDILKNIEMKEFNDFFAGKFNNKTNGITHRRWCLYTNPELVSILKETLSDQWIHQPSALENLLKYRDNREILYKLKQMKLARKEALAKKIFQIEGITINPHSIFDVQVKRLHEYKRQLMNALHILYLYQELKTNENFKRNYYPHTFIFGAKAAPTYFMAKKIIKLINCIAEKVNNDASVNQLLKVVFVKNYNVTYAESIMPACDISEQISTASKEASGTGNMKFMMNGAITIGTLDGANVEIKDLVGEENIQIFGLTAEEVNRLNKDKTYRPKDIYQQNPLLKQIIDSLTNGFFEGVEEEEFLSIRESLLNRDEYYVLKDFEDYRRAHENLNEIYKNEQVWLQMSLVNIAKSGFFSTDRTIHEYNQEIWKLNKIERK